MLGKYTQIPDDSFEIISLSLQDHPPTMDLQTKAYLLSIGTVDLDAPLPRSDKPSQTSTSGPGAGGQSIFFQSGGRLVRLSIVPGSPLRLELCGEGPDGSASILQGSKVLAKGRLVPPLSHCPDQAYITVSERCIFDCKFCAVPKMMGDAKSPERIAGMVESCHATGSLRAISLTSGVEHSPRGEALRMAQIVRDLKRFGVPVGVSVCPFPGVNQILRDAGADEVKYNIETFDPEIFARVCPGMSMDEIRSALKEAVGIFGKNHVFTNVIVGLGESDETMRRGIDEMAEMGVLPVLRAVYPHPLRMGETEMNRPGAERLQSLARYALQAFDRNGLRGDQALTMCYRCTGCDLVPHRDL
jgi:biotin synthase-related radical SAM superfamily protein